MHVDQAGRHYMTAGGELRAYPTYLLPRSFRDEAGRPRKETLVNLTGLPEVSIEALRATLRGAPWSMRRRHSRWSGPCRTAMWQRRT
jgi:hypothetical protein